MHESDRTWAEVSLGAIRRNFEAARRAFAGVSLMTVMKADAYGHGIAGLVSVCEPRTDWYAVATAEEGAAIRRAGGKKPVLIFGPVPQGKLLRAAEDGLTFSVGSVPYARSLSEAVTAAGRTADVHLKLDTGLNRTGVRWREGREDEALDALLTIASLPGLRVTGTYTHFACPEPGSAEDDAFTRMQATRFHAALDAMASAGLEPGLRHCCATGGAIARPEYRLDMVRLGMMIYGQCDTLPNMRRLELRQAICWKSRVVQTEMLAAGEFVSYGRTFRAERDMRLGVVSCGYADGYRRSYQSWGIVLVCGRRVRTLGRVCMDYLLIDLTDVPEAGTGSEVVLLGRQGPEEITPMEISSAVGSVCGEVTAAISPRVPRYYLAEEDAHV